MRTLKYFSIFLAWNLLMGAAVYLLPPLPALTVVVAMYLLLVRAFLTGTGRATARRRALLRLRPLTGPALRWTLLCVPVLLALVWALESLYVQIVPVPVQSLDPLGPLMSTPLGALTVTVLAVGIAPVIEEIFFRGFIQRSLELRLGATWGIGIASALFAAVHVLPWIFPLHLLLGIAFGFAVYATRSIWAGVLLHAANNAAALLGRAAFGGDPSATPTVWEIGPTPDLWTGLASALAAGALAFWIGRRLWWVGRRPRSLAVSAASRLDLPEGGRR